MASPIPHALNQFIDNRGNPLSNGSVSLFQPGTTTPKPTWRDPAQTIPNANPVVLDTNGRAPIFGYGRYRQQVRTANGTLLFDGETSLGEGNLPLASQLAGLTIDADIQQIVTSGFTVTGRGAARYARLATSPSPTEIAAGQGRWLFTTNAGTVWWALAEVEPTDLMFGVQANAVATALGGTLSVTGPDDTDALQAAIDYVLYFSASGGRRLRMPAGIRRVSRTIHIGYGDRYLDWQILGDQARGFDANTGYLSGIYPSFNDRPVLNIQGARSSRLESVAIIGSNHAWLAANEEAIADRAVLANWRGSQLQPATVNTRHAPYCGIAIDGYSGPRQAVSSYPDALYPAWLGAMPQYDKGASSEVKFRDVAVLGFEVGIAVQPNLMPAASNGDFLGWTDCDLGSNLVGLAISHSDARCIAIDRCRFHGCHTAIDSLTYGSGAGNLAAHINNSSFDRVFRMFNVNLGIAAQPFAPCLTLTNMFAEAAYSIGRVRGPGATGRPGAIRFIGGEIGFALRSGEYSPANHLAGPGILARFEDISIHGTFGLFTTDCDVAEWSAALPAVSQLVYEQGTLAGRRAASALCGIEAPEIAAASVRPFSLFGVNNAAFFNLRIKSHGWDFTAGGAAPSALHVPLFARSADHAGYHAPLASTPEERLDRALYPLGNLTKSGIEWTFTVPGDFLSAPDDPACCLGTGDIVTDEATGLRYYVKIVTFAGSGASLMVTMTLRQINRVRSTDGVTWSTDHVLPTTIGVLRFRCARRVLFGAKRRLAIQTEAGSNQASLVAIGPETFAADDFGEVIPTVAVGDYLQPAGRGAATLDDSAFTRARITAIATSGGNPTGAITLDAPARRTGIWHAPLVIKAD